MFDSDGMKWKYAVHGSFAGGEKKSCKLEKRGGSAETISVEPTDSLASVLSGSVCANCNNAPLSTRLSVDPVHVYEYKCAFRCSLGSHTVTHNGMSTSRLHAVF